MSKSGSDGFPDDDKFSRSGTRSRSPSPVPRPTQNRRVIIANIPYDVSWHEIRELFRDRLGFAGYLMMYKQNGRPNGMASMEFKTIEGADKAIQLMNRFILNGRKLVVREECARDKERLALMEIDSDAPKISTRPPIIDDRGLRRGHMDHPPNMIDTDTFLSDSVYISNLEFSISAAKIRGVFKAAGEVVNVKLKTDQDGNPRGVAIVSFSHPSEATLAVKMFNGQNLKDRTMRVRIYRSDPNGDSTRIPGGIMRSGVGRPGYSEQPRYPRGPMPPINPQGAAPAPVQSAAAAAATLSLLLSGSPEAAAFGHLLSSGGGAGGPSSGSGGVTDLLRLLSTAGGGGTDGGIDGGAGGRGGPRMDNRYAGDGYSRPPRAGGIAPSDSALQQLMTAALSGGMPYAQIASSLSALGYDVPQEDSMMSRMNVDHELGGDRRRGDTYYAASRDRSRPRILPSGPPILAGRAKQGFMPAGIRHREEDRNGRRDLNRVTSSDGRGGGAQVEIVVKNLPYSYAWQDVKRIFRETGNVHYCNMPLDPEGKSQGVAYIGYSSADECESAVDRFNGSVFDGRRIKVQMAA